MNDDIKNLKTVSTGKLENAIGEAIFEQLIQRREMKTVTMKGPDGVPYSDDNPGWLDGAIVLAEYFAPGTAWGNDVNVIALIQTAVRDLKKAIEVAPEYTARISGYEQLKMSLEEFFKRNNLTQED